MSLIYTSPTSRNNLYLGGKVDAKSLSTLQQRNVVRILNVTPAKEAGITAGVPNFFENSNSSKIKYKRISVYDASTSDLLSYADEIVQFISNGLHHGSVLVHCQRGVSRSTTSVIMFLMRKANMTLNQSLKLCQRRRPIADPIPSFLDQLRTYEKECRSWGHLTAMDETQGDERANGKDIEARKKVDEKDGGAGDKKSPSVGGKRKSDGAGDGEKKKRIAGPMVGPPRGPVKSVSIGPAMGPPTSTSSEKIKSDRSNAGGGKPKGVDGKRLLDRRKEDEKSAVGPTNRPSSKAIGPMKPPSA
ncbi:hypothetical protein ACHAXR_004301 [Thalassiosira sp. AJA248-18]